MKICVTGGAGFIGSCFVRNFANGLYGEIDEITILDKLSYAGNLDNLGHFLNSGAKLNFIQGDISDTNIVTALISNHDAIINFAAESHVDRSISDSHAFIQTNVLGVQVILDAILKYNPNARFLQVSTDEVYGSLKSGKADENFGYYPNSPYAASKAAAELIIRSYVNTHKIDGVVSRGSNTFGPFQNPEKLIPLAITNILMNQKVPIYGNGTNVREWIDVDSHANAIYRILLKGRTGETYNIPGGTERSNLEVVNAILNYLNCENQIEYVADRKGHDFRYAIDPSKYLHEISRQEATDFQDKLYKTIDWYKMNREWWEPLRQK